VNGGKYQRVLTVDKEELFLQIYVDENFKPGMPKTGPRVGNKN